MKNKGFTLVELLGVIAILGIIGSITVTIVSNVINKGLDDTNNAQIKSIEKAAKNWANENPFSIKDKVKVSELQDQGYLEEECIKNPKIDKKDECSYNNACVIIENKGTTANPKYEFTFEQDSSKCS